MSPWANLVEKTEPEEHVVQLYGSDDELLVKNVGRYLAEGLDHGEGLLVIATSKHGDALASALARDGVDLAAVTRRGQLVWHDAERTLPTFMVDGEPDEERFTATIGGLLGEVRPLAGHRGIRAFGEMVGLLWAAGQRSAAIRLEGCWNRLLRLHSVRLFCAYPIDVFSADFEMHAVDGVLCAHTDVLPADRRLQGALNLAMHEVLGPRLDELRPLIKANYRPSWASLPRAEAVILWIRNNLPDCAEEILGRARTYYISRDGTAPVPRRA